MTEPRDRGQPHDALSSTDRAVIERVVFTWARQLPPRMRLMEFLGGRSARASDVARAMRVNSSPVDRIRLLLPFRRRRNQDLADHIFNLFAVNAQLYGLEELLAQFAGFGTAEGPAVAGA